jgi:hypothetical protein
MMRWRVVVLFALLAVAACAAKSDSDNSQHSGFYGGISGGGHP